MCTPNQQAVMGSIIEIQLAQRGFDPIYGARPLKRLIRREVKDPLAQRDVQTGP